MKEIVTGSGIVIREIDIPKFAKDKGVFNLLNIPHDSRRPHQIEVTMNGEEVVIRPTDGWAQVAFEAKFGPNKIVFRNVDRKPITYEYMVRYRTIVRNGRKETLDWKKEHNTRRHRMNWDSLVTS